MMNDQRIRQIANRHTVGSGADVLGKACVVDGVQGRIDAVFIDLAAAIACGVVGPGWFAERSGRDLTTRDECWYSVVLRHGSVLVGQRELVLCP
jgi:hypothetical protein